ncbi:hypothetical protein WA026_012374 [Henosepilachna vigintioctopunctata]|uniref:Glycosyltransferase family 92 protein n=1 Tax=Henosepilachna vigintioctopunctata TaxID=420089 RepID=A0AAW1USX8_9CUCU
MKKYKQLLLIIFSFTSLILFLVYRHEYNRLHYILEVFNFFGTPCNFSEISGSERVLDHYDWGENPIWQENDNFYTFSGFMNDSSAQVIALATKEAKLPKRCFIWYDNNESPRVGHMDYSQLAKDEDYSVYIFKCGFTNQFIKSVPYALSFRSKSSNVFNKKVMLTKLENRPIFVKTTICVLPAKYNKRELIEFISFHKLIGIKYFIFYYNDIPYSVIKFLGNLADILDLKTTFLQWNFPKYSTTLADIIVQKDCELRTSKKSLAYVVLKMNEYLIPLSSFSVHPLFEHYTPNFIDIPVQKVCISSNVTFYPIAIQNTNSIDDGNLHVIKFNFNVPNIKSKNVSQNEFQMVIHAYEYCSNYSGRIVTDQTISRYSTDFIRSTLVQLLIHDQI